MVIKKKVLILDILRRNRLFICLIKLGNIIEDN